MTYLLWHNALQHAIVTILHVEPPTWWNQRLNSPVLFAKCQITASSMICQKPRTIQCRCFHHHHHQTHKYKELCIQWHPSIHHPYPASTALWLLHGLWNRPLFPSQMAMVSRSDHVCSMAKYRGQHFASNRAIPWKFNLKIVCKTMDWVMYTTGIRLQMKPIFTSMDFMCQVCVFYGFTQQETFNGI